jgi:hypothetical protein
MASLIGKRIGGQRYYYLREVARVGGRPKIVSQRYLGKAEDHRRGDGRCRGGPEVTGSRRPDAAASVGTYLALAALNRAGARPAVQQPSHPSVHLTWLTTVPRSSRSVPRGHTEPLIDW